MPSSPPILAADAIATCAAAIALLALGATLWQGVIARRHARLSVRPVLDYCDVRESLSNWGLTVVNHGLGPAIVTRVSMRVDGRPFDQLDAEYKSFVTDQLFGYGIAGTFQALTPGTPIPAASELVLFKLVIPPNDDSRLHAAARFMDEIALTIDYRSMYEEEFTLRRNPKGA